MSLTARARLVEALLEAGRRLDALGLVPARDGNLSARLGPDRILITAAGTAKRALGPGDLVEVDLDGVVHGAGRPSTELALHLAVYRRRGDVHAVVHAHPPVATGFAAAGLGLTEPLVAEAVVGLGPVPVAPYAGPGTPELAAAIEEVARLHRAFLLANHGAVALGATVAEAVERMETLEHLARISLVARLLGGGRPLDPAQIDALLPPPTAP